MNQSGIILLDEDVQRALYTDNQRSSLPDSLQTYPRTLLYQPDYHLGATGGSGNGSGGGGGGRGSGPRREPRTDFTRRPEPRTDFTQRADARTDFTTPRTDFTTGPRTDFTNKPVPRTDFTSRREPRTDFTGGNQAGPGLPRTDFTTQDRRSSGGHLSAGKPSNLTHTSSLAATANVDYPTSRGHGDNTLFEDVRGDSYPILRDDPTRASSTGSASQSNGVEYAGTSSGLKISVRWIMAGLFAGLVIGVLFSELKVSNVAAQWISLPGDLFIRALKCLVVPYVFCSVAVAVGDIVFVGKVSVVGWQTAKIFVMFWICTVATGMAVAMVFRPAFRAVQRVSDISPNSIGLTCADKLLLTTSANGSVACSTNATVLTSATTFVIQDLNDVFDKNQNEVATVSLSEQLMIIVTTIVSDNLITSLATSRLLSVITFSMLLGSIAGRSYFTKTRRVNYLYLSLLQLRNTFFLLMEWTIWLSPVAVVSIVAGSFASNKNFTATFKDVYPLLLAAVTTALIQVLVVYPLIVFLLTRCNPYSHMRGMVRAYLFAFASASSLATMPVTLTCVKKARMCSQSVANFVISIGVVSGLSGMGWYMPIALTFLAEASGNGDNMTPLRVVGMFVLSVLACAGTPPIPASSLVVISTAYSTLFGTLPKTTFALIMAVDFVIDRLCTVCNVNDDIMALKIISETTDETVAQDHLGERF